MTLGLPEKRVLLYILKLRRFLQKPNPCILLQAINIVNRATGIILLPVRRCLIKLSFIYFHKKIKKHFNSNIFDPTPEGMMGRGGITTFPYHEPKI